MPQPKRSGATEEELLWPVMHVKEVEIASQSKRIEKKKKKSHTEHTGCRLAAPTLESREAEHMKQSV